MGASRLMVDSWPPIYVENIFTCQIDKGMGLIFRQQLTHCFGQIQRSFLSQWRTNSDHLAQTFLTALNLPMNTTCFSVQRRRRPSVPSLSTSERRLKRQVQRTCFWRSNVFLKFMSRCFPYMPHFLQPKIWFAFPSTVRKSCMLELVEQLWIDLIHSSAWSWFSVSRCCEPECSVLPSKKPRLHLYGSDHPVAAPRKSLGPSFAFDHRVLALRFLA